MKNVRCSFKTLALLACGVLFLSLLGGHAAAARRPQPQYRLWPQSASLDVGGTISVNPASGFHVVQWYVSWPLATGVDHYRLAVGNGLDESPASYEITPEGDAIRRFQGAGPGTLKKMTLDYKITVTAYSGPDEATAYSESLQATLRLSYP
jgi:hypothetical protein